MACSKRTGLVLAVLCVASVAYAVPSAWRTLAGSTPLGSRMEWGDVATMQPPLDPAILQRRAMTATEGATAGTSQVLALYAEDLTGGSLRHLWPLYVETRTEHASASAVGVTSRLWNGGEGWGTALHAEPIATGSGTTIGVNVEVSPLGTGRTVGLNMQAKASYLGAAATGPVNQAINLQSDPGTSYVDGIRYECSAWTGLHFAPGSQTTRAIWIEGSHSVGIDTSAPIRLQGGVPLQLEGTAQVQLVFANGRIEFRNGARVLAWIAIDAAATGARLN